MIFVDTNVFLRFLVKENLDQHGQARKLLEDGAEGKLDLRSSVIVFFELFWVLTSFYKKNKADVIKVLTDVSKMKFIDWNDDNLLPETLKLFKRKNIEMEDAFNIVFARKMKMKTMMSFDKKLLKVWREVAP